MNEIRKCGACGCALVPCPEFDGAVECVSCFNIYRLGANGRLVKACAVCGVVECSGVDPRAACQSADDAAAA